MIKNLFMCLLAVTLLAACNAGLTPTSQSPQATTNASASTALSDSEDDANQGQWSLKSHGQGFWIIKHNNQTAS